MTQTPQRPWFQFHLTTAIVTALAAGVVLALEFKSQRQVFNFDPPEDAYSGPVISHPSSTVKLYIEDERKGFPWYCWQASTFLDRETGAYSETSFDWNYLLLDAGFILTVLLAVALTTEFNLRRLAARTRGHTEGR